MLSTSDHELRLGHTFTPETQSEYHRAMQEISTGFRRAIFGDDDTMTFEFQDGIAVVEPSGNIILYEDRDFEMN